MIAIAGFLTSLSSVAVAKNRVPRDCELTVETFCLTTPATMLHEYDFHQGAKMYLIRTAYGNFYIYEGTLSNVAGEHKVNLNKFPRSRGKAEYKAFYSGGLQQAYIRREQDERPLELHVWAEDERATVEELGNLLSSLYLF